MKTTQKQFKLFKKYCLKWANKFGLQGWDLYFKLGNIKYNSAEYNLTFSARACTITLNNYLTVKPKKKDLEDFASHEIIHIRLAILEQFCRLQLHDELQEAQEHEIIHAIQKISGILN